MASDRDDRLIGCHAERVIDEGWTIIEDAIDPTLVADLRSAVRTLAAELDTPLSRPGIEGNVTKRIYNLLPKGKIFRRMPTHPVVHSLARTVLNDECLLSGTTTIDVGPGEAGQTLHADDVALDTVLHRPHAAMSITCIWALTDFTADNGATRFVPGSHAWAAGPWDDDRPTDVVIRAAEMSAGSVLVLHGSTWHGAGPNTTADQWRLGAWVQYCHGFIRQQQNPYVGIPLEVVRTFDPDLQRLCGYELYRGILGHVDGVSPAEAAALA